MKSQLVLLSLVVLFVSLSSVVFARPPVRPLPSGETSEAAPKVEAVKKSWEGPFFGLGLGLGLARAEFAALEESLSSPTVATIPFQIRAGYGLSDSFVLYGSILGLRFTGEQAQWTHPAGLLGMMWRWSGRDSYGFTSVGFSFEGNPVRPLYFRGGHGTEVYPGIFVEGAGSIEYFNLNGVSATSYVADITFNYHWY